MHSYEAQFQQFDCIGNTISIEVKFDNHMITPHARPGTFPWMHWQTFNRTTGVVQFMGESLRGPSCSH